MKLVKKQKIFLILLIAISSISCSKLPEFPNWNPYLIIPSQNKKIQCKLIDKEKMIFECEPESEELNGSLDGSFCSIAEETKAIINWASDAKKYVEKNCNNNGQISD